MVDPALTLKYLRMRFRMQINVDIENAAFSNY